MISMIVSSDMACSELSTCFLQSAAWPLRPVRPSFVGSETQLAAFWTFDAMTVRIADLAPATRLPRPRASRRNDLDHGRVEQSLVQPLQVGDNDLAADNPRLIETALRHYAG